MTNEKIEEKKEKIVNKWNRENEQIEINRVSKWNERKAKYGVNWSAIGTRTPTEARLFSNKLLEASDLVDKVNKMGDKNGKEKKQ